MERRANRRVALTVTGALLTTVAFSFGCEPRFTGLEEFVPHVKALNGVLPGFGDGYGTSTKATISHTFQIRADAALRHKIDYELVARGYRATRGTGGTGYEKHGGIMSVKSYAVVRDDGTIYVGASRSRWPRW